MATMARETRRAVKKNKAPEKNPEARGMVTPSWVGRVPKITPGNYADGLPFHELGSVCCKLILRPNHFNSRASLFEFADVMREPAREHNVVLTTKGFEARPLKIREVLFIDSADFRLYKNAFILRRRVPYRDGFPIGDPEVVFKYRSAELQMAAEADVRPQIRGEHRVKFKCQALPLKERLGGVRLLYSHNVQFPRSALGHISHDMRTFAFIEQIFPVLSRIRNDPQEAIDVVNHTIIEEVLQDIAALDFGHGVIAKANVGIWRTRGEHQPVIGEFAFEVQFTDRAQLHREALQRFEAFFITLQYAAKDYISLNATKTGIVYRLLGNAPSAHE